MKHSVQIFMLVLGTAFFLAACGGDPIVSPPLSTTAQPSSVGSLPAIPTDQGEPEQPITSRKTQPPEPTPLAGISPCSVVPPESVIKRGATGPGTEVRLALGRHCDWAVPQGAIFSATFFDTAGVKDATGDGPKTPITIGNHEAIQQLRGSLCAVSIAINETSRVDIQFMPKETEPAAACPHAKALADEVEPHLPPQVR